MSTDVSLDDLARRTADRMASRRRGAVIVLSASARPVNRPGLELPTGLCAPMAPAANGST